jgi:glycosyltransferase involved in cell wall biosynthesis
MAARIAAGELGAGAAGLTAMRIQLAESHVAWAAYEGPLVHELDSSFPQPTPAALLASDALLGGLPDGALVVIDGLAFGAMPELATRHAERLRLVALVHHPLALETGLDAAQATRLRESEAIALRHARRVMVTSERTARLLADYDVPTTRIYVVEPGTDPAPLTMPRAAGGPLRLLSVGTITPRKGHLVLVEALGELTGLDWRLDCAGSLERDPRTAMALRKRIAALGLGTRVRLLGELPPSALRGLYARADLFVLASLFEGYGMAYAEALARGLPVLGTTGGAIADTVPTDAGILVQPPMPCLPISRVRAGPGRCRSSTSAAALAPTCAIWRPCWHSRRQTRDRSASTGTAWIRMFSCSRGCRCASPIGRDALDWACARRAMRWSWRAPAGRPGSAPGN